jgi:hypothetical protein
MTKEAALVFLKIDTAYGLQLKAECSKLTAIIIP